MADTRLLIEQAAMKGVRIHGINGVRVQHISKLSGMTASSIYTYFDGKDDLMVACFERVDRQIAALFDQITITKKEMKESPEEAVRKLWLPYYQWLVAHPDETVFYHLFRDDPGFPAYNERRDYSYFAGFIKIVNGFHSVYPDLGGMKNDILWIHVLNETVMYAKYVVEGTLPNTTETENAIFAFLMYGLNGIVIGKQSSRKKS
jgi:hypothetical protein